jgi:PTS system nitrogen regulatory IIA component
MQRSHDTYTIRKEMLERWADEHKLEIQDQSMGGAQKSVEEPEFDSILLAMQRGGVFFNLPGSDRQAALRAAVGHIPNIEPDDRDRVYEKLIERERLASTGIGHGIALPHPRTHPEISLAMPQITTCFLSGAVPFEAIDGQPVQVLMVLLSHSTKQHLVMLSKLSFLLRDQTFRKLLLTKPSRAEIFNIISTLESNRD